MHRFLLLLSFATILYACETSDSDETPEQIISFSGKASKGPFLTGSEVTIVELDRQLRPTGKTYFTEILDNDGSFEVDGIKLKSDFIEVRVEGFFYDEVMRTTPENELTISSLVKITDGQISHVNILTHLERKRVALLINAGASYEAAKAQARMELMEVFGFNTPVSHATESMELLSNNDASGVLFAASCIIAATVPWKVGDDFALWNSFLVQFANDFEDNGIIDNKKIRQWLYGGAFYVKNNVEQIRKGITDKFKDQFFDYEIPQFEYYIDQHLASSIYAGSLEDMINRMFPVYADGAINLLRLPDQTSIHPDSAYVIHIEPQVSDIPYHIMLEFHSSSSFGEVIFSSEGWTDYREDNGWKEIVHHITNTTEEGIHYPVLFSGTGNLDYSMEFFMHHVPESHYARISW